MKCEIQLRRSQSRVFVAGDEIDGSVVLRVNNNTLINEVSIHILGYAKCVWTFDNSLHHLQSNRTRVEHLNANILLLHKPKHGQTFTKGRHALSFIFQLPESLPASFSSLEGYVKYKIVIFIKRFGKSDLHFEYPFIVTQIVNLNHIEGVGRPLLKVTSKEFTIDFTSKSLYMMAMISQQGYIPHQVIDVRAQIDNRTIVYVKYVKISLKKIIEFKSQNPGVEARRVEVTKAAVYCGDVPAHDKRLFVKYLKVPQLLPNIENCEILRVSYEVQVKAKTIGATRSAAVRLPIQIGTIALIRDSQYDYEMDMPQLQRLEFAPMSYDACMAMNSNATTPEIAECDLIDLNLPSYEEALRLKDETQVSDDVNRN